MPKPPLTDEIKSLLAQPLAAVMASLRPDGSPLSVPTWYLLEDDGRILINMDDRRVRLEHVRQDPRVALTVLGESWYQHVSLRGRIDEFKADDGPRGHRPALHALRRQPVPRPRAPAHERLDRDRPLAWVACLSYSPKSR